MVKLKFIDSSGNEHTVDADEGETLMQVATANSISGIDGDCGGCCACGTCCMQFPETVFEQLGELADDELGVLEFVESDQQHVRLGCQIEVSSALDGVVIKVAT